MDFPSLNRSVVQGFECYCNTILNPAQPDRVKAHLEKCAAYSFTMSSMKELIDGLETKAELQVAKIYLNMQIDAKLQKFAQEPHKDVQKTKPSGEFDFSKALQVR